MVKLSIIIVNYNARAFLRDCLRSLYRRTYDFTIEVIVVDNASHDGSVAMVIEAYPQVRLIETGRNLGFARGNNVGIRVCRGEFVLLLNSDTSVLGEALATLVRFLDTRPEVAVASARVVYPDLTDQGVARAFPTPWNALFGRQSLLTRLFPNNRISRKYLVSRQGHADEPFEVDWVSGACLMARKSVLDDVGRLDERFFMYWEDADLCFRIKQENWKVYCVPAAVVVHYEGKSSVGPGSSRLIVEFNRSVYRYYRKHHIAYDCDPRNVAALCGLSMRTIALLIIHASRRAWKGAQGR